MTTAAYNLNPFEDSRCPACAEVGTISSMRVPFGETGLTTSMRTCSACGWRRVDVPRVRTQEKCIDCAKDLKHVSSRYVTEKIKAHYCADCSRKRVAAKQHDRKGAVTVFPLVCPDCSQETGNTVSHPEAKYDQLPASHHIHVCVDCSAKKNQPATDGK